MPPHLAAVVGISFSPIGGQRLLLIRDVDVGVGGQVLTVRENAVHLAEVGND